MSLETVLKNVYGYLEVLQTACTDKVLSWDRNDLQDALKWAKYCEQVYRQAEGKPYQDQLDASIQRMRELPWAIGQRKVTLNTLRQAERGLKQALLQNPNVSDSVYEELMCSYGDPKQTPSALIKDIVELSSVTQASQVALHSLQTQSPVNGSVFNPESIETYSTAEILLDYAAKLMNCPTERTTQCEKLLVSKLHKIVCGEEGLQVVATACSLPSVQKGHTKAQSVMVTWLMTQQRPLFSLSGRLLAEVSRVHFVFYKAYIHHLTTAAHSAEVHACSSGMINYRLSGDRGYGELTRRLGWLMHAGEPVATATLLTLEALSRQDAVGLWKRILKTLLILRGKQYKG